MNQATNLLRFFASFIAPMKVEERTGLVTPRLEIYLSKGRYLLDGPHVNYSFGGLATVFREERRRGFACDRWCVGCGRTRQGEEGRMKRPLDMLFAVWRNRRRLL